MSRTALEAQLEAATQEFVRKIIGILRGASLADVASVEVGAPPTSAARAPRSRPAFGAPRGPGRPRSNGGDLAPKILEAIQQAGSPVSARALSDQLAVSLDALQKPLKQLRDEGRIVKRGEKRASKYAPT